MKEISHKHKCQKTLVFLQKHYLKDKNDTMQKNGNRIMRVPLIAVELIGKDYLQSLNS